MNTDRTQRDFSTRDGLQQGAVLAANSATPSTAQGKAAFVFFCLWSLILLCRPQDYLHFLAAARPTLTVGLFTLLVYLFSAKQSEGLLGSSQFRLFLCFLAILAIGVPFSYYRSASFKDFLSYASVNLMFFYLFYQLATTSRRIMTFLFICCCGTALYSLFVLRLGAFYNDRIAFGTMFDPNDIAFFIICFIAFNLLFFFGKGSFGKRIVALLNIMVCFFVLWKSGSRSGLLACFTVFAYLTLVRTRTVRVPFEVKAVLATAVVAVLFTFNVMTDRYKTILEFQDDYNVTSETGRVMIWKIGLRLLLARPLTGVGMNRFNEGVGKDREARGLPATQWQSPHNSLVQVGAETGIFGLFVFCLMSYRVFTITGAVKRRARSEDLIRIAEMTRAGFFGHAVSAMFLSQAFSIYWLFYVALAAVLQRQLDREQCPDEIIETEGSLYPYADNLRRG